MITFEVLGTPAPKGSARAMLIGGRARVIASGSSANQSALKSWDVAVREAAREAVGLVLAPPFVGVPIRLDVTFRLARPGSHFAKRGGLRPSAPLWPTTKPDSSKLLRATEDSMTGIVYGDDSLIVSTRVYKTYAAPGTEGATITVRSVPK